MNEIKPISRWGCRIFGAMLASALTLVPARVGYAYCVRPYDFIGFWSSAFPSLQIPVWVNSSEQYSVAHTGRSAQDVARVLLEVIARHNETVIAPKLYFAGFVDDDLLPGQANAVLNLQAGITVLSYQCNIINVQNEGDLCGAISNTKVHGCGTSASHPMSYPVGWIILAPAGCPTITTPPGKWSLTGDVDIAQVLLHELGHALGLEHANRTKPQCEGGNALHGNAPGGNTGVMHGVNSANYPAFRTWRRDDLDGLAHLYSPAWGALEIAWWEDDNYPDYPADELAESLIGMLAARSVAVSNLAPSSVQVLATTAPDGRVLHRLVDSKGVAWPDPVDAIVDPGPHGRTWAMPAAALGRDGSSERVFVAWLADETSESISGTLRVASRAPDSLAWTFHAHPDSFSVNRLTASYVPDSRTFVLTTLAAFTSAIELVLFDFDGSPLGQPIVLDSVAAFDVGVPVCAGSRCLIPYSEPSFGGPNFGVVELEVDGVKGSVSLLSNEVHSPLDTSGRLGLLDDSLTILGWTGAQRFELGSYPGLNPDPFPYEHNPATDWPLGVSAWINRADTTRRIFQPRPVVCGNGILQAGEGCDDANTEPGDGCSPMCAIEPEPDDDDQLGGGGNDEVGEAGEASPSQSECECRADGSRGLWAGLVFSLLLGLRRPRNPLRPAGSSR